MNRLMHWLAHKLGWNEGACNSYWDGDRLMMSFVCRGCGQRSGVHEVPKYLYSR